MTIRPAYDGHPHAHPSTPAVRRREVPEDRCHSSDDIAIEVNLDDQPGPAGFVDVYCPKVRRRPFVTADHVNLLDVISCWKGLSHTQATEVSIWNRLFREGLEEQLRDAVRAEVLHGIPLEEPSLSEDTFAQGHRQPLPVDIWRLLHYMITAFYSMNTSISSQTSWFVSTGDLPGMVFNLVRTHDCFTGSRPFVEADISCRRLHDRLHLVADVVWQGPPLDFSGLATRIQPGMEYIITPEHGSDKFGPDASFPQFPGEIEFAVRSHKLPLVWDPDTHSFLAVVPSKELREPGCISPTDGRRDTVYTAHSCNFLLDLYGAPRKQETAETTFFAKSVLLFPGNVRHERTSRYSIKLDIDHPENPQQATDTWGSCNAERFTTRDPSPMPAPSLVNEYQDKSPKRHKVATEDARSPVFHDHSAFQKQRLALDPFEHVDLESDTKPSTFAKRADSGIGSIPAAFNDDMSGVEELWVGDHLSVLVNATASCSAKVARNATPAINAASWTQKLTDRTEPAVIRTRSRAYEANLAESKVMPSLRKRGSVKRIVFHHHKRDDWQLHECPTPEDSDHPSSPGSDTYRRSRELRAKYEEPLTKKYEKASLQNSSPGSDASSRVREIRANYKEFLEKKQTKARRQRLGHPDLETDDDNGEEQRKAFESLFLEDSQSEGWATDTDMSSVRSRVSSAQHF
ncbi:hypothetical protein K458DRAFT_388028 [Lentithecium fluviatile CBS 122367]|uniref:Uncharacterized protein n=1 Tax=Lentithecium fluviatile CBS 122367 TaxID=1168545 RepID=A0A6G1J3M9_9PLEO|nr:hypothetical protein K458DRAFT_388028 [Lentithecium fluviatile CBS 122367]